MHFKGDTMKIALIVIGVIIILGLMIPEGTLEVLSDISGVMFMIFALLSMLLIGASIAIEMAKRLRLEMLEKELNTLREEKQFLKSKNNFYIKFTNQAIVLEKSLKAIQDKKLRLQESSYESIQ